MDNNIKIPHEQSECRDFFKEIIPLLVRKNYTKKQVNKLKIQLCRKHRMKKIPTDIEIMLHATPQQFQKIKKTLLTKPTRSLSGVTPIAVMSAPYKCPHGKCTFCPGGPGSVFGDVPQSYTGREPSTLRAIRANYDPYIIVFNRLEQYIVTGHMPQKAEVIIQGGTFPAMPEKYKKTFIKDIYQALNDFGALFFTKTNEIDIKKFKAFFDLPNNIKTKERQEKINKKILSLRCPASTRKLMHGDAHKEFLNTEYKSFTSEASRRDLLKEQQRNETANIRCVGLTVETKPDWGFAVHGKTLLEMGVTRIELGVQSVYEEPLRVTNRGHTLADTRRSIQELRDLGFKLNFHYMLGLPKTTKEMDIVGLRELFNNQTYRPDMLKIYPCMVLKGTPLYSLWKAGAYTPMTTATAAEIIADFMQFIPSYCRIMRVQRDIPTNVTDAGVDRTNLRQYIEMIITEKNIMTQEIRAREIGSILKKDPLIQLHAPKIVSIEYEASGGKEFFISLEDTNNHVLFGFVRLRLPGKYLCKEITSTTALIRELHVFGEAAAFGTKGTVQHKGFGKRLMQEAEKIANQLGKNKIVVISAVGTREYYKKLGYEKEGPYMTKRI